MGLSFSPLFYRNSNDLDKPKEECGVFACYSKNRTDVSRILYFGLQTLQHRGQESAGITLYNKHTNKFNTHKNHGLVTDVFSEKTLNTLEGNCGIGHVRYSTVGTSIYENIQPMVSRSEEDIMAIAHNGTIHNSVSLRELLEDAGSKFESDSDTEIILELIRKKKRHGFKNSLKKAMSVLHGSYSIVALLEDKIIGIRDPFGIRPLCIGQLEDGSYIISSESCAFNVVGATYIRDVLAGEIVIIDENGIESVVFSENNDPHPCAFEQIYFARPDSQFNNRSIYSIRSYTGRLLYEQTRIQADVVLGVPQSGLPAANGYSEASGIPFEIGIVKNVYSKRSFINPTQEMRENEISIKLSVVTQIVEGKKVIVIDDSLVRGNTSRRLISMLRRHGAKEVHFMSASPPIRFPCFFGIDIAKRKELAAHENSIEDLAKKLEADTLNFLDVDNLKKGLGGKTHCLGCFTGTYPTYAPKEEVE